MKRYRQTVPCRISAFLAPGIILLALTILSFNDLSAQNQSPESGAIRESRKKTNPATDPNEIKTIKTVTPKNRSAEKIASPVDMQKDLDEIKKRMQELENKIEAVHQHSHERFGLNINGFFDIRASNYQTPMNNLEIGTFELDIERLYKEHFQVAAALVFNREHSQVGVAFIDYHLFGGSISPRGRLFVEKGLHLQVGKFDVPFGNDWQSFAAKNRLTVTEPLTTTLIMDGGYNDTGVRLLANLLWINATLFALNGIDNKQDLHGNSFGGRIGLTPFSNPYSLKAKQAPIMELGFSCILDTNKKNGLDERLYALDLENKIGFFLLRSEYLYRRRTHGTTRDGYHITSGIDFSGLIAWPVTLYGRYEYYRKEQIDSKPALGRAGCGITVNIADISVIKLEYLQFTRTYDQYTQDGNFAKRLYSIQLTIVF